MAASDSLLLSDSPCTRDQRRYHLSSLLLLGETASSYVQRAIHCGKCSFESTVSDSLWASLEITYIWNAVTCFIVVILAYDCSSRHCYSWTNFWTYKNIYSLLVKYCNNEHPKKYINTIDISPTTLNLSIQQILFLLSRVLIFFILPFESVYEGFRGQF